MQGWLKLYRELLMKPIWTGSTPEQKTILVTILLMANYDSREWEWRGEKYTAKRGQFITSLPAIAEKAGKNISIQKVRTALKRFEKYGFLTDESTRQNRLITIVNWDVYQKDQQNRTGELTVNQQTSNRQVTASKNVSIKESKKHPYSLYEKASVTNDNFPYQLNF